MKYMDLKYILNVLHALLVETEGQLQFLVSCKKINIRYYFPPKIFILPSAAAFSFLMDFSSDAFLSSVQSLMMSFAYHLLIMNV